MEDSVLEDDEIEFNRINMTPLVDVCLTLVLVFMVTMPLSVIYGINIKRETLKQYGLSTAQENVIVHLTGRGLYIQDENEQDQPVPYEDFGMVLRQMIQMSDSKKVFLRIERNVPHGQTVWALDLSKQNGAEDISIFEGG